MCIFNRIFCVVLAWFFIFCIITTVEAANHTFSESEVASINCTRVTVLRQKTAKLEVKLEIELETLTPQRQWTYDDVDVISRMVWGEARGVSRNEQKLVVWTVINRLENGNYGDSLIRVVRARGQFHGYSPRFPVTPEIREMVIEVLEAWDRGEAALVYSPFAETPYYLYFSARRWNGWSHNFFRETWR